LFKGVSSNFKSEKTVNDTTSSPTNNQPHSPRHSISPQEVLIPCVSAEVFAVPSNTTAVVNQKQNTASGTTTNNDTIISKAEYDLTSNAIIAQLNLLQRMAQFQNEEFLGVTWIELAKWYFMEVCYILLLLFNLT
jgi:hypothetical protein